MLTRKQAQERLFSYNPKEHLVQHALATEAVMRALARKLDQDEDLWGITGLLHDLDYPMTEQTPERHGAAACELLPEMPQEALDAIKAHNGEMTGLMPQNQFDYALRCAESVTGLINAAALVRPDGIYGMQAKSLRKKMKDKAFAASVSRECIQECSHLGLELGDFLTLAIEAMTPIVGRQTD